MVYPKSIQNEYSHSGKNSRLFGFSPKILILILYYESSIHNIMTPSRSNVQIRDELIEKLQILAANRIPYSIIHELTGVSTGSISKYCRDIRKLPQNMCHNPFDLMSDEEMKKIYKERERTPENLELAKSLGDIDYFREQYEIGTRFEGPLNKISLSELQELMSEPTDYHSPLKIGKWMEYYLQGREGAFLTKHPHLWCDLQMQMFNLHEEHKRLMVETFRDAGKTMVANGILSRAICEHRENNYFIMSETKAKAGKRIKQIGDVLISNKKIIADYGFLPNIKKFKGLKQSWKSDEITVKRHFKQTDPSLMGFSTESPAATGAHFAGGVYDDVWSFSLEQNSMRNKEKFFGWYDGELEGCMEDAWELWLLTRKGPTDLYQDLEDSQFYVVYKEPAVIKFPTKWKVIYKNVKGQKVFDYIKVQSKDGKITSDGNGRFSMEFFLEKKVKMRADKFESEYQLNPIAAAGRFWKKKDLRYILGYSTFFNELKKRNALKLLKIIGFMDLGFGKKSRADFSALTIVGFFDRKYYFLELYLKRGASENQLVQMMADAKNTFPQLRDIYIEADLQQTNKVDRLKRKTRFVNIKPFLSRQEMNRLKKEDSAARADLGPKPLRIWLQLEGIIEDNALYINKYMRNYKEFTDEFRTFPMCEHFDVLDALGNNCSIFSVKSAFMFALHG